MTAIRQYIDILNEYLLVEDYKTAKTAFVNKGANAEDVDRVFAVYRELVNRNQITGNEKNIDWWAKNKTWEEMVKFVHEKSKAKSITQLKRSKAAGDSINLYEDDDWLVVVPLDKSASCFHGRDTDWCTTKPFQGHFEQYFYDNEITLIYCISKKDDRRFAIAAHRASSVIELFDKDDREIELKQFIKDSEFDPESLIELAHTKENLSKMSASRDQYQKIVSLLRTKFKDDISANDNELLEQLAYVKNNDLSYLYFFKLFRSKQQPSSRAIKLLANPWVVYMTAKNAIRGRWPEAEPYIMKDPFHAYLYARDVIKGRWPEAEPIIMQNNEWGKAYRTYFNIKQKYWTT